MQLPITLLAAPIVFGQVAPDPPQLAVPSAMPQGDVKSFGPSALTPERLAEILSSDAAALATESPRVGRRSTTMQKPAALEQRAVTSGRLQQLIVDPNAVPGVVWAGGRDWKAEFAASGVTYFPRLGKASPRNMPTTFELARVARGGEPLAFRAATVHADGADVVLDRGALREVYHLAVDSIEQTFVFDAVPGAGDLVVEIAVESQWQVVPGADAIRFVDGQFGEVQYGRAYGIDASGARIEIERVWTGDGIMLTVPAAFLSDAVLPLTIDPVIVSAVSLTQDDDESRPDVCYDSASGLYWLVYQDYFSATDTDVYIVSMTESGVLGTPFAIDFTADAWAEPAVAASPASHNLLVVASTTPDGPGSANADIEGRFVDTTTLATSGAQFVIDTQTHNCVKPDVGGSWGGAAVYSDYCVVWQRDFSPTDIDILGRVVNQDGTFLTNVLNVANSAAESDYAPAISKSRGDESFSGDFWNIAWIRDNDHDGLGTPFSSRVYFDGTFNGAAEQIVFNTLLARNVDVTSTFDAAVPGLGQRPFIVTFERDTNNGDIYAAVCTQLGALSVANISLLEDFDASLISRDPSIATDGTSFFLAFDELWWHSGPGGDDYDTYALSGNLSYGQNGAYVALSERHKSLQFTTEAQIRCQVASQTDGGGLADDAIVAWEDRSLGNANGGTIRLATFDSATSDASEQQAIGQQYCQANPHADSGDDGRRSSFISARGNASVGSIQTLYCDEMKLNAFAYFIVSSTTGDVNMPGSSLGRLCLGSPIGRLVGGAIHHTGLTGSISIGFNPLNLPSPTGNFSAAPGQTLYFQCWHRDTTSGGAAASNFSNACGILFRP
jgi:hypothetical protein